VSRRTVYGTGVNQVPEKLTFEPWVRWPPCGSDMASTVSPGWSSAA
jgi:hypothetical protein